MSYQVIMRPDGKLAIWSTGVDDWVRTGLSPRQVVRWFEHRAAASAREDARRIVEHVRAGAAREVYYQFAMTWEEAEALRREGQPEEPEPHKIGACWCGDHHAIAQVRQLNGYEQL